MDLVSRAKGILLNPKSEWVAIEGESTTVAALYSGYIIPLAAIPAICGFIGFSVIGWNIMGTSFKMSMTEGLEWAILRFAGALVGTYVLALIIDALAPNFGGQKNQMQALKVAAYSSTAAWVAGIFTILPALGILGILAIYSLYLFYLGLPILMKSPEDKALAYTIVVIICAIVVTVILTTITSTVVPMPGLGRLNP